MKNRVTIDYIELIIERIEKIQMEVIDQGNLKGNLDLEAKKRLSSILQDTIDVLQNELLLEELNNNPWIKKR